MNDPEALFVLMFIFMFIPLGVGLWKKYELLAKVTLERPTYVPAP